MLRVTHESAGASEVVVLAGINSTHIAIANFKGTYAVARIPGVGFSVEAPYVRARGGGDIGASHDETFVFLGAWASTPPTSVKSGEGEDIAIKGQLKPGAPTLSVQNIYVRIQANAELVQKIISEIDWNALKQLIAER